LNKTWLSLLLCVFLFPPALRAQEKKPLLCGTDLEGGIPYLFGAKDDPKSHIGFEVDLMKALAKKMGRPIAHEHTAFDSLLPALNRSDFDFAMNGLEITGVNRKQADFTRPYYIYQLQLVGRVGEKRFTTIEECKALGLTVGTLDGSAAYRLLKEKGVEISAWPDQDNPFKLLAGGDIDAVLMDLPIAIYYAVSDKEIEHRKEDYPGLQFIGAPFAEGHYGIAVRHDDDALRKELDDALGEIIQSGELKSILTKWHLWSPDQYRLYTPLKLEAASTLELGFADYFTILLKGAGLTVLITIASMMLAMLIGLPIATLRLYAPLPLRWLAIGYVEFFRGIPVLLLLLFLYFGLPPLTGIHLSPLMAAIIGFGLNYAAYEAEIYRGGIQSIPVGQWEAAASLGMSPLLTFRRIVFPQSVRVILPPMTNDFIALFKDTSVASVISVIELSKDYQILTKTYGGFIEIGLTTAALYLVMSVPLGYLSRYLEMRWGTK